jgi:predicted metal-dependent hydrolase
MTSPTRAIEMSTTWGARRIDYLLHLEARNDLVVAVQPDLAVHVRAPTGRSIERIQARVEARRPWIVRQLASFAAMSPLPPPRFVSGETLFYRGRQYRLRVRAGDRGVSIDGKRIVVSVRRSAVSEAVRWALVEWYRARAENAFDRRVAALQQENVALRNIPISLRVRRMSRRWGSCTPTGIISLNPALIQTPDPCIDYVLLHELLHLIEPAHSSRFHRLLERSMPDWQNRRRRLSRAEVRWF